MKLSHLAPQFKDARGIILDVLTGEPVDSVTFITSAKGAMRANHYHRETLQWLYVLEGKVRAYHRMPGQKVEFADLVPGDLLLNEAMEEHAIEALEDSTFLVLTRGPRSGKDYESDTYRLERSLKEALEG